MQQQPQQQQHAVEQLSLAPLGAGDLIDRTIRLYRRHFSALIRASVPPVVVSAAGAVFYAVGARAISITSDGGWLVAYVLLVAFGALLVVGSYLFHFVVMGGAAHNLVRHLLWQEPVTARTIYRRVRERFWGLVGAGFAVFVCVMVAAGAFVAVIFLYTFIVLIIVGLVASASSGPPGELASWVMAVVGIISFLASWLVALWVFFLLAGRIAYVPQVMLVEGRGVFASISRSAQLARGNVRRLMALFLFINFGALSVLMLLLIPLGWYGWLHGLDPFSMSAAARPVWYAVGWQVMFQASMILLAPVLMLGLSLLYVDERVRHEGYDIELMAARTFGEMPTLPPGWLSPLTPAIVTPFATTANTQHDIPPPPQEPPPPAPAKPTGSVLGLS